MKVLVVLIFAGNVYGTTPYPGTLDQCREEVTAINDRAAEVLRRGVGQDGKPLTEKQRSHMAKSRFECREG